jgi:hypothetical protein
MLNDVLKMKIIVGGEYGSSGGCQKKACKTSSDCSGYCTNIHSPGINGCIGQYCM